MRLRPPVSYMADIERYTPDDRRGIEQLYRRTFGNEAADRVRLRWDWARRNPAERRRAAVLGGARRPDADRRLPADAGPRRRRRHRGRRARGAPIRWWSPSGSGRAWAARCCARGIAAPASRSAPRCRAPRAAGSTKCAGRRPQPLPCLVKPISRRALRIPTWPVAINRLVSAFALAGRARRVAGAAAARRKSKSSGGSTRAPIGCGSGWPAGLPSPCGATRATSTGSSSSRRTCATRSALLRRGEEVDGYAVYRHLREPQGRVTQIVDLLADPSDERGLKTLARWVDREARAADSDKIRCYATHASIRRVLRRSGYFVVKSGVDLTVKVNAVGVPKGFLSKRPTTGTSLWATGISITRVRVRRVQSSDCRELSQHVIRANTERRHRDGDEGEGCRRGSRRCGC